MEKAAHSAPGTALALTALGKPCEATTVRLDPFWRFAGQVHVHKGQLDQASALFDQALQTEAFYEDALYLRALVHLQVSAAQFPVRVFR